MSQQRLVLALSTIFATITFANNSVFAQEPGKIASEHKPLIGINVDIAGTAPKQAVISTLYINAIESAGGIPVLLPPSSKSNIPQLLKTLDGMVLIGGADYPPAMYGQKSEPSVCEMIKERADFDTSLAKEAIEHSNIPVLGICAGCQILNIAAGGSLEQDIPSHHPESKVAHASPDGWQKGFNHHTVKFESGSKLATIYGETGLSEPTSHHQCVDHVGKNFKVSAKSEDGLTEGIELAGERFVVGVQYHPERDFEHNKKLFQAFVEQAQRHSTN